MSCGRHPDHSRDEDLMANMRPTLKEQEKKLNPILKREKKRKREQELFAVKRVLCPDLDKVADENFSDISEVTPATARTNHSPELFDLTVMIIKMNKERDLRREALRRLEIESYERIRKLQLLNESKMDSILAEMLRSSQQMNLHRQQMNLQMNLHMQQMNLHRQQMYLQMQQMNMEKFAFLQEMIVQLIQKK
jgi:hypothetical protein